jgi:hypothetical protein
MKKTEKIELRVDHEEKERLSAIAERRGQTVSDVVRDALAAELGVAAPAYPKWPGQIAVAALFLSGFSILVTAVAFALLDTGGASGPGLAKLSYPKTVQVIAQSYTRSELGGIVGRQSIAFDIPVDRAEDRTFELDPGDGQTIRIALATRPDEDGLLLRVDAQSCIVDAQGCEMKPMPSVSLQARPSRVARAETSARLSALTDVEIELHAVTQRFDPPQDTQG